MSGWEVIHLDPSAEHPQGVITVRGVAYPITADMCRRIAADRWEVHGPAGVVFRDGDAAWFATGGGQVQLVTEDVPGRPGWLRFRAMPAPDGAQQ